MRGIQTQLLHHGGCFMSFPSASTLSSNPSAYRVEREKPFVATFTLDAGVDPEFYFKDVLDAQKFGASNTISFSAADFVVTRSKNDGKLTYRVESADPFQVKIGGATHSVDRTGGVDLNSNSLSLPASRITYVPQVWTNFAEEVTRLQTQARTSGNEEVAEKIGGNLSALKRLLDSEAIPSARDLLQARDALNNYLQLASLGIRELRVRNDYFALRQTGYGFTIPQRQNGDPPNVSFTIPGNPPQVLSTFGPQSFVQDDGRRSWAVSEGKSVFVSREKIGDRYEYKVYFRNDFNGAVDINTPGAMGLFTIAATVNRENGTAVVSHRPREEGRILCVPPALMSVARPEKSAAWVRFDGDVAVLCERISVSRADLKNAIVQQSAQLGELVFGAVPGSETAIREASVSLQRLLDQTAVPGSMQLVRGYRQVWLSSSHYRWETVETWIQNPGIPAPQVPPAPLPVLGGQSVSPSAKVDPPPHAPQSVDTIRAKLRSSSCPFSEFSAALDHSDSLVRQIAVANLWMRSSAERATVFSKVSRMLIDDPSNDVRRVIAIDFGVFSRGDSAVAFKEILNGLSRALLDRSPEVRSSALSALRYSGANARDAAPAVERLLTASDTRIRREALECLIAIGVRTEAVPTLVTILQSESTDEYTKQYALACLGTLGTRVKENRDVIRLVEAATGSTNEDTKLYAACALAAIKTDQADRALPILRQVISISTSDHRRSTALDALSLMGTGGRPAVADVLGLLTFEQTDRRSTRLRVKALQTLSALGSSAAKEVLDKREAVPNDVPVFFEALSDTRKEVRQAALTGIERRGKTGIGAALPPILAKLQTMAQSDTDDFIRRVARAVHDHLK